MIRNGVPGSQIQKGDVIAFNSKEGTMKVFDSRYGQPLYWEHIGPDNKYFIGNENKFSIVVDILSDALGHLKPRRFCVKQEDYDIAFILE